jgi:glycosyltransferase involved in cell wall biosynthesis
MIKVMIIGPSLKSIGGVSFVQKNYLKLLQDEFRKKEYDIEYSFHPTQVDGSRIKKLIYAIYSLLNFLILINKNKPDIVHAHTGIGMGFWRKSIFLFFSKLFSCKTILHLHTSAKEYYESLSPFKKRIFSRALDNADLILTVTKENQEFIESSFFKETKMIDNPIEISSEKPEYRLNGSIEDFSFILHLGELSADKGIYEFLNLAKKCEDLGWKYQFVAAGKGRIDLVEDYVRKQNISNFSYLGFLDEENKKKVFKKTRYLVLLTKFDQKPIVIQEALANGIPCIVSNVGGIPEMIEHKKNGFIFSPTEFSEICNVLSKVDKDTYFQMVENAFNSSKKYDASNIALKLRDIYTKLLAKDE